MRIEYGVLTDVSVSDIPEDGKFIVPDGVTIIGFNAFRDCVNMTSIVIPDGVTDIGDLAFLGCKGLTEIIIPDSVKNVGYHAFDGCSAITSAIIPLTAINAIPRINLRTVVITSGTRIEDGVFEYCSSLTSIVIPDSVVDIGSYVFYCCRGLTSVTIGKNVTRIGSNAFYGCSSLTSITLPDSVESIGDWAFCSCVELRAITIPDSVANIGRNAFRACYKLKKIIIGNGVVNIGNGAFYATSLKSAHKNYKAFGLSPDGSLVCRKKTYKVGKRSLVRGILSLCENGLHYCTNLFEIFDYYYGEYGKDFVISECEVSKEQKGERGSSKRCARWIIPQRILTREEVMKTLSEGRR